MKFTREIKTAILAILAILLFIFGFNYLKGKDLFDNANKVLAKFDNSYGLTNSAPVSYNGIQVGKVYDVFNDFEKNEVIVEFSIRKDVPFTKESIVKLIKDPLSGVSLALIPSGTGGQIVSGDFVKSTVDKGLVDKLQESLSGLSTDLNGTLKSADTLLFSLNALAKDDLKKAVEELNATMKSFKYTSYSLNQMIKNDRSNLNEMIKNFSETGEKFGKVADSLEQANFGKTLKTLDKTIGNLNNVLANLEKGQGTMGKLLNDDQLYNNLEGATKEMKELLEDIKLHPKRYFRILSKKEIPYNEEK